MSYSVLSVQTADISQATDVISNGLLQDPHPYVTATWGNLDTAAGRAEACRRFHRLREALSDPSHFLKVVDDETGRIVACSISLHRFEYADQDLKAWGRDVSNDNMDYAAHLKSQRDALLAKACKDHDSPVTGKQTRLESILCTRLMASSDLAELRAFFVEPSVQMRGIGRLLMRHLKERQDQDDLPIVLIANPNAVGFYQKQGFSIVEEATLPVPTKWHDRSIVRLVSMCYKKNRSTSLT